MRGIDAIKASSSGSDAHHGIHLWRVLSAGLIGAGISYAVIDNHGPGTNPSILFLILGIAGLVLPRIYHAGGRYRIARSISQRADEKRFGEFTFDPDTIQLRNALGETKFKWRASSLAYETKLGLLVFSPEMLGYWIDATWFRHQSDADLVVSWAREGAQKFNSAASLIVPPDKPAFGDYELDA